MFFLPQFSILLFMSCIVFLDITAKANTISPKHIDTTVLSGALSADESSVNVASTIQQIEKPVEAVVKPQMRFDWPNMTGVLQVRGKEEVFWGRNINLLNNSFAADTIGFVRHTIDLNGNIKFGKQTYGTDAAEIFGTLRNKVSWGNPESIAQTTNVRLKVLESVDSGHSHALTKQVIWFRELWLKVSVNKAMSLPWGTQHWFTAGTFPFELGRGISLGSAFAVNPGILGFYSDNTVDQYAYGALLNGEIVPSVLTYDLYTAILENKGSSLSETGAKIYGQRLGFRSHPERGPGKIDYIFASRLRWTPIKEKNGTITLEPYVLINRVPEQKIEFPSDAAATLGTLGGAGEAFLGDLEFGFDAAFNMGTQSVYGWDRNEIEQALANTVDGSGNPISVVTRVNSQVMTQQPTTISPNQPKAPYIMGGPNQAFITTTPNDPYQNGQAIPGTNPVWYNSLHRFSPAYKNIFKGWMGVMDAAYWLKDRQVRLAATAGLASGDKNPNQDYCNSNDSSLDKSFRGFVPLQEMYTGNRVQSVFLLGGAGRIPRPLSSPVSTSVIDRMPSTVSGFTNLIFTGGSIQWLPKRVLHNSNFRFNLLSFWQEFPTNKFDRKAYLAHKKDPSIPLPPPVPARTHLGVEANIFSDFELVKDLRLYMVASVFVPGAHYTDIKGKPLNKEQEKILDSVDVTGDTDVIDGLLGDNLAYTFNIGLDFRF